MSDTYLRQRETISDKAWEGQRDRGTEGQRDRGTEGQRDRGTEGQAGRQADRQTDRHTDRHRQLDNDVMPCLLVSRTQVSRQGRSGGGQGKMAWPYIQWNALQLLPVAVQHQQLFLLPCFASGHCTTTDPLNTTYLH